MIVQPDFLDHWKTRLLIETLNDPCAPLYLIRLWAHCQNRKTHRFALGSFGKIKAICHAPQNCEIFSNALHECGFIRIEGDEFIAHDWENVNASLIAAWDNGKRGGRPKGKNPRVTHGEPKSNPDETDREDKIEKIDKKEHLPPSAGKISEKEKDFVERWNKITGKQYRVLTSKAKSQIKARIKDGFSVEDIFTAAKNCAANPWNGENGKDSPEYVTRPSTFQEFLNARPNSSKRSVEPMKEMTDEDCTI